MQTKIYYFFFAILLLTDAAVGQLVYQEEDTNENRKPQGHMIKPVASTKCAEGELLYPGDNPGDWACDCRPAFLYFPQTGKCYQAFSKGPCKEREILVLPKSKVIPVCEANTCEVGKVKYKNNCVKLYSYEACQQPSKNPKAHQLIIVPSTLQLNCTALLSSRLPEIDEEEGLYESHDCFLGGKRSQEGVCQ